MSDQQKNTRSEQARINGAKSKGPTSPEGKTASSKNALKHGFAAHINVLISIDDSDAWHTHLAGYRASFHHPTNLFESDLVDQLASIAWRKSRLVALETALIDFELSIQAETINEIHLPQEGDHADAAFRFVLAWQGLARKALNNNQQPAAVDPTAPPDGLDIGSIELVRRYQTSLDRQHRTAMSSLRQYRKDFGVASSAAAQNSMQQEVVPAPPNEPNVAHEPEGPTVEKPNEPKLRPAHAPLQASKPQSGGRAGQEQQSDPSSPSSTMTPPRIAA